MATRKPSIKSAIRNQDVHQLLWAMADEISKDMSNEQSQYDMTDMLKVANQIISLKRIKEEVVDNGEADKAKAEEAEVAAFLNTSGPVRERSL